MPRRALCALVTLTLLGALTGSACSADEPVPLETGPTNPPVATDPPAGADLDAAPASPAPLVRAENPRQVARQILAAEDVIADPATSGDDLKTAARRQQVAYRALGTAESRWVVGFEVILGAYTPLLMAATRPVSRSG